MSFVERQLKLWHLVLGIIIAGGGNLVAIGMWAGNQAAVIREVRAQQDAQAAAIKQLSGDLTRVERDSVQLIDLKLRISRVEDKLDRIEPKLSELIGELKNSVKRP